MPRRAWASGDERALQITCGGCDEQTVISLMRLRTLAFLRCGCGNMLLDEDEVREYRRRLERLTSRVGGNSPMQPVCSTPRYHFEF